MNVKHGPGGDGGDLTDAMRQWLRDEAAKTQAWLVENPPVAGMHTHNSAEADPAVLDWAVQHDHGEFDEPPWDTATDGS